MAKSPITEYDPATCVTFKELRAKGFPFPAEIPDDAWVPKRAIRATNPIENWSGGKKKQVVMEIRFTEPIRRGNTFYRIHGDQVVEEKLDDRG